MSPSSALPIWPEKPWSAAFEPVFIFDELAVKFGMNSRSSGFEDGRKGRRFGGGTTVKPEEKRNWW